MAIKQYGRNSIFLSIVIFISCMVSHITISYSMDTTILRIQDIKSNYAIASDGENKCILYNVHDVDLMDTIVVEGVYEKIYSSKNAGTFQFETYMKQRGIHISMYVKKYSIVEKSKHPRAFMYRYIKNHSTCKEELLSFFYKQRQEKDSFLFVSGMHLHFLSNCLSLMFKKKKSYFDIGISFLYCLFFPVSSSILCMFYFALIMLIFHDKSKIDQCGIAILVLLFFNPYMIYEVSFQLIVLFRLITYFDRRHCNEKIKQFLILFPFQLYHFHMFTIFEFIFFKWIRLLQSVCFIGGICAICIPKTSFIFLQLLTIYTHIEKMFESYCIIGKPYFLWIIVWIMVSVFYISNKKKHYLINYIILIIIQLQLPFFNPFGEVSFLDVGQGDCIYIREPFSNKVVLIDVAENKNNSIVENNIYPYLKMQGIKKIEKIIITHDDFDHSGGLHNLNNYVDIKEVIREKKQQICLNTFCLYNVTNKNYEDINDNSVVLFAHIGTLNYLFMGDASKEVELDILDAYNQLKIDVLKVGHHGSNTSSDETFIGSIHPLIGVISSGKNNYYGHPHKEVIEVLEKNDTYILNTQTSGSITIFFTSFINFLRTGSNEFGIMR